MTDEQLEAAARKLCEIRGIDPDEMMSHGAPPNPHGFIPAVLLMSPAWRVLAGEILSFYQVAKAVDSVFNKGLQ